MIVGQETENCHLPRVFMYFDSMQKGQLVNTEFMQFRGAKKLTLLLVAVSFPMRFEFIWYLLNSALVSVT